MNLSTANYFFLIFFLTVVVIRVFLYFKPTSGPTIMGLRVHHYMFGLVLVLIGYVLANITIYAIGLALFIDEFTYILINGETHKDNYSMISIIGTVIFVILVFLLRGKLIF